MVRLGLNETTKQEVDRMMLKVPSLRTLADNEVELTPTTSGLTP
jgi:hypothetical protein